MTELPHVLLDTTVDGTEAMGELGARLAAVLRAGDLVVLTGRSVPARRP